MPDDALLRTANDLYMQARAFQDSEQMLTAMRTFVAATRLLPTDARMLMKLQQIRTQAAATIAVPHNGAMLGLPVWIPQTPAAVGEPGSADDLVATFFKWKRIPIFRNDSAHCSVHQHEKLTIMGQSCLSSLYISTHNMVHAIMRGESRDTAENAIPTSSRVRCGAGCGVSVPERISLLLTSALDLNLSSSLGHSHTQLLWSGAGPAGEQLTIYRGETRAAAMERLVRTMLVLPGKAERAAAAVMRKGIIETLVARRPAMLDSVRPFVHRAQALGDPLGAGAAQQEVVMSSSSDSNCDGCTGMRSKARRMVWDMMSNTVTLAAGASVEDFSLQARQEDEQLPLQSGVLEDGAAEEEAARYLWEHQHPAECSTRKALVYMHDRAYWGFAANVHFMTMAFQYALAFNRTFLAKESDHWNYGGRDCRHGWHCYFQPLSTCSERDVWQPFSVPVRLDHWWDHRGYLYHIDTHEAHVLTYGNTDGPWQEVIGNQPGPHGGPVRQWIPAQFRERGLLWWRAQLTRYLMRPKAWVLAYINQRRRALSLPLSPLAAGGVVGLHVRRGDKSYDHYQGAVFGSIDSYIAKARALNSHAVAMYVSTDDPSVIESLPRTAQRHNLTMVCDDLEPRFNGTHIYAPPGISLARWPAFPGNDPNVNTTLYALETIKSIWLLTFSCEHFVGTVTSSMSRLIYQLRIAFGQPVLIDEWTLDQDARHPPGWFADP